MFTKDSTQAAEFQIGSVPKWTGVVGVASSGLQASGYNKRAEMRLDDSSRLYSRTSEQKVNAPVLDFRDESGGRSEVGDFGAQGERDSS